MQKITTRSEKDLKRGRNQLIIGAVLIGLMLFSTLGYAFGNANKDEIESVNYGGVEFIKDNSGYWNFNVQGYNFYTKYNPQETEDIHFLNYQSIQDYNGKPLYFAGGYQEPFSEIGRNLNYFVERINEACLDSNCEGDFPIKNCSEDNIIVINEINYNKSEGIYQEENCIYITAALENQTRYADAYLFKLLGLK